MGLYIGFRKVFQLVKHFLFLGDIVLLIIGKQLTIEQEHMLYNLVISIFIEIIANYL